MARTSLACVRVFFFPSVCPMVANSLSTTCDAYAYCTDVNMSIHIIHSTDEKCAAMLFDVFNGLRYFFGTMFILHSEASLC